MSEQDAIEFAIAYLRKRGYRVLPPLTPRRELPGQIRVIDYDPDTGELRSERFLQERGMPMADQVDLVPGQSYVLTVDRTRGRQVTYEAEFVGPDPEREGWWVFSLDGSVMLRVEDEVLAGVEPTA